MKKFRFFFLVCLIFLAGILMVVPIFPAFASVESPTAQGRGRTFSLVELSEMASEATVYIEAFRDGESIAFGSGFVIDPTGVVVTNFHVLERADDALVRIGNTTFDPVLVLAADEYWDLAILKINGSNLATLNLGKGIDTVKLGEEVLAVGNPEGWERTISNGIVSALRYSEEIDFTMIQTTAPISSGSSGGPLLNMRGEVIGVNTLSYTTGQNLNFAVPIDLVQRLLLVTGEAESIAERFAVSAASGWYTHQFGDFVVVLDWEGDFNLDLEIWSEEFVYLNDASFLGDSPDIRHGDDGEEWFVFQQKSPVKIGEEDFSRGRYVISPYFNSPQTEKPVLASLTIHFRSGERTLIERQLSYNPPYDQWFAVMVDLDQGLVEVLDFFDD